MYIYLWYNPTHILAEAQVKSARRSCASDPGPKCHSAIWPEPWAQMSVYMRTIETMAQFRWLGDFQAQEVVIFFWHLSHGGPEPVCQLVCINLYVYVYTCIYIYMCICIYVNIFIGKQASSFSGFFMSMRSKFTDPSVEIYYYIVEWEPDSLSWADFRGKVLGLQIK